MSDHRELMERVLKNFTDQVLDNLPGTESGKMAAKAAFLSGITVGVTTIFPELAECRTEEQAAEMLDGIKEFITDEMADMMGSFVRNFLSESRPNTGFVVGNN